MRQRGWEHRGGGRAGQGTLEYILLVAAIIVAIIVGVNSVIRPAVKGVMNDSQTTIEKASSGLKTKLGL